MGKIRPEGKGFREGAKCNIGNISVPVNIIKKVIEKKIVEHSSEHLVCSENLFVGLTGTDI